MKDRIKSVRKKANMSQEQFGNRLGITKSSVSLLESGKNSPSEQTIKLICSEFNVNEDWLRTGSGGDENMFIELPKGDEIASLIYDLLGPDKTSFQHLIIEIMRTYRKLTPASQQVIDGYISDLVKNLKTEKGD